VAATSQPTQLDRLALARALSLSLSLSFTSPVLIKRRVVQLVWFSAIVPSYESGSSFTLQFVLNSVCVHFDLLLLVWFKRHHDHNHHPHPHHPFDSSTQRRRHVQNGVYSAPLVSATHLGASRSRHTLHDHCEARCGRQRERDRTVQGSSSFRVLPVDVGRRLSRRGPLFGAGSAGSSLSVRIGVRHREADVRLEDEREELRPTRK
jgi:hypothetical protein